MVLFCLFVSFCWSGHSAPQGSTNFRNRDPTPAANCAANNTYPAINAQLYTNNPTNFTTGMRDDTAFNRNWDSANLIVQQSDQVAYSNTSLTNLGVYNASYSFQDDRSGGLPENWACSWNAATSIQVITPYVGHQKVLQLYDNGAGGADAVYATNTFTAQAAGTVSFWFCMTPITCQYIRVAIAGAAGNGPYFLFGNSQLCALNGGWINLLTPTANRWYHFNVTFVAGATRTYNVDIDGVRVATGFPFQAAATTITTFSFYTDTGGTTNFYGWMDAVDYSWTPGYDASKSRNAIDWGQIGIYNSTNSFENDTMFAAPTSALYGTWADGSGATCYAKVFPQVATGAYGHRNVLALNDQNAGTSASVTYTLANAITQGWVEAWILSADTSKTTQGQFILYATGYAAYICNIYIVVNVLYAYGTGAVALGAVASNTWYHIRIQFNTDIDLFSVWVNGMLRSSNQAGGAAADVKRVYYDTGALANTAFQVYLDGLDISSDPTYVTERSTYLRLNSTSTFPVPNQMLSFPVAGSYAYKWVCWSSNIDYNQQPTPFTVRENVQLISESTVATRWVLTSTATTTTWNQAFLQDFLYENWVLSGYTDPYINGTTWVTTTKDARTEFNNPASNYGTDQYTRTYEDSTGTTNFYDAWFGYSQNPGDYLASNRTRVYGKVYTYGTLNAVVNISTADNSWGETTITWNNQPDWTHLISQTTLANGWTYFESIYDTGDFGIATIRSPIAFGRDAFFYTREYAADPTKRPAVRFDYSKFYQGNGICYMQTNTTEALTLRSPANTTISLVAGDRITVGFNSTSDSQILFRLLDDGVVVKSWPDNPLVVEGSTTTTPQVRSYTLTEAVTFNQTDFTGTLDNAQYLSVDYILFEHPTYSGSFPPVESYIDPDGMVFQGLPVDSYTLNVYECAALQYSTNVTVASNILNTFTFTPTAERERVILYYDIAAKPIAYSVFWVNVTRTLDGDTDKFLSTIDRFYADDGTTITVETWDKFGNLLSNVTQAVEDFIDIMISNIYSVKIKNEMLYSTLIELSLTYSYSQYLSSGEMVEYSLFAASYTLNYTQNELGTNISTTLVVSGPMLYVLNSTAKGLYFVARSSSGIDVSSYLLGLNATHYGWGGPIQWLGDYVNIGVADPWDTGVIGSVWMDGTVYGMSALTGCTLPAVDGQFYEVLIDIYSFKVNNLMRESTLCQVYDGTHTTHWDQYVQAGEVAEWQLAAGTYSLEYHNPELGTDIVQALVVAGAMQYIINTSYYAMYISAYSADAPQIPLDSFRLFIDGTQYFWGWNELLADSYAFVVKDWFDANVYSAMRTISDASPINLPLTVYSLKIQNLMRNDTYYTLNSPGGSLGRWLLAGTEDELVVGGGVYQLLYTQAETNTPVTYNFPAITTSVRYVMNTSYHSIFFSCFSNDGLGVPAETCRLYVNQSSSLMVRVPWGPVELLGVTNVTVFDYINETQFSSVLDLSHVTELNIFVNIATVITNNNLRNESIGISVSKHGTLLQNQTIGAGSGFLFRFTNGQYQVKCTYMNGTEETKIVDVLAGSTDLETYRLDFGFYTDPVIPRDVPFDLWETVSIWVVVILGVMVIAVAYLAIKVRATKKKQRENQGIEWGAK